MRGVFISEKVTECHRCHRVNMMFLRGGRTMNTRAAGQVSVDDEKQI
jgi:hypothetical protein